jgi:hypothetical protein
MTDGPELQAAETVEKGDQAVVRPLAELSEAGRSFSHFHVLILHNS